MKKIIPLFLLLIVSVTSFSQSTTTPVTDIKTDYLKKRKNQNTAAWCLLAGGSALFLTAYIIESDQWMISTNSPRYNHSKGTATDIIGVTSIAAQLVSIPFFIAAAKNRRKAIAANAFFKMERAPVIQKAGFISQNFPAIALKFSL